MIKIYGPKQSTASRSLWAAAEVGQQVENVHVDFQAGEHKGEAYLKLNPNGKVPVMMDGDFVLWESSAINAYLAETYKPELLGSTTQERALVNQWSYWAIANLAHPFEVLILQKYRSTPDSEETGSARAAAARFLPILDGVLSGKDYLVADRFTLADLNVASIVNMTPFIGIDTSGYPNITRWLKTISERPAFKSLAS